MKVTTTADTAKKMALLLPNEDLMLPFVGAERTAEKDGVSAGHAQEAILRASVDLATVGSAIKPASFEAGPGGPEHSNRGGISGKGRRLGRIASGGSLGIASSVPSGVPAIGTAQPQLPESPALPACLPLLPKSLSDQSLDISDASNQECAGPKVYNSQLFYSRCTV